MYKTLKHAPPWTRLRHASKRGEETQIQAVLKEEVADPEQLAGLSGKELAPPVQKLPTGTLNRSGGCGELAG